MTRRALGLVAAVVAPGLITLALVPLGGISRDYVFIYLAAVAVLAVVSGLVPAMVAALPPPHRSSRMQRGDCRNWVRPKRSRRRCAI